MNLKKIKDGNWLRGDGLLGKGSMGGREVVYVHQAIDDDSSAKYSLHNMFPNNSIETLDNFMRDLAQYKKELGLESEVTDYGYNNYSIYFYKNGSDFSAVSFQVYIYPKDDYYQKVASYLDDKVSDSRRIKDSITAQNVRSIRNKYKDLCMQRGRIGVDGTSRSYKDINDEILNSFSKEELAFNALMDYELFYYWDKDEAQRALERLQYFYPDATMEYLKQVYNACKDAVWEIYG